MIALKDFKEINYVVSDKSNYLIFDIQGEYQNKIYHYSEKITKQWYISNQHCDINNKIWEFLEHKLEEYVNKENGGKT